MVRKTVDHFRWPVFVTIEIIISSADLLAAFIIVTTMARRPRQQNSSDALSVLEQLQLFTDRARQLWDSRARREGLKFSFNVKGSAEDDLVASGLDEPDVEDFRSYLLTFRQFISESEPLYLGRIYNLCHRYITDETCKEYLAEARTIWRQQSKKSGLGMTLKLNSVTLTPKDIADIWINGHYFHSDPDLVHTIRNLDPILLSSSRAIFLNYVIETSNTIFHAGKTIHVALKRGWLNVNP